MSNNVVKKLQIDADKGSCKVKKNYKLMAEDIKRMIPDCGYAFITDMITVDGKNVDYMYRENADHEGDSGWRFYGGGETQEYIDNPNNTSILSLNTIANYDSEVIPFLTYPVGTKIERNAEGKLEVITKEIEEPAVIFLQPVDKGVVQVTKSWQFEIVSRMVRRIEEGSFVIWKPGFTIWLNTYFSEDIPKSERLEKLIQLRSSSSYDFKQEDSDRLTKIRYQLNEEGQESVYIFGLNEEHEIHIAIYFDSDEYFNEIDGIWNTLTSTDINEIISD